MVGPDPDDLDLNLMRQRSWKALALLRGKPNPVVTYYHDESLDKLIMERYIEKMEIGDHFEIFRRRMLERFKDKYPNLFP